MSIRTYRALVAGKLIVTVLVPENVRPAEETIVEKPLPLVLPWTERVSVRLPHPSGSLRTTWSMLIELPRSTWAHCGRAPELSQ